jgi:DNA-binding Lrp family transcriptional regulator
MKKPDPASPKLTQNDKEVLRRLISHSKIPDSKIATELGISPQAVFKIRSKLEQLGIIQGYAPIIDFKKVGIEVVALVVFQVKPSVWERYTDDQVSEIVCNIPHSIAAYRVVHANASHVIVVGFRDTEQRELFLSKLQTACSDDLSVKDIYLFSVDKILTQNPLSLLQAVIEKKDSVDYKLF